MEPTASVLVRACRRNPSKVRYVIPWIVALIPFLSLVLLIFKYHVDVPYRDDWWDIVPRVGKLYEGRLTFAELFDYGAEHRPFFPRAMLLFLIHLTHWNTIYLLMANALSALGAFLVLHRQAIVTTRSWGDSRACWLTPAFSLLLFSWSQWENWLRGDGNYQLFAVLGVVAGIYLLSTHSLNTLRYLGAFVCGLFATYSNASGLAYWPIGLLILAVFYSSRRQRHWLVAWSLLGSIVLVLYLKDYRTPTPSTSWTFPVSHPFAFWRHVLNFLAGPLAWSDPVHAWIVGLMGILIFLGTPAILLRTQRMEFQALIPYIAFGLYAFASALMTGVGRASAGFGLGFSMIPHYQTLATPFWVANLAFLYFLMIKRRDSFRFSPETPLRVGAGFAFFAIIFLSVYHLPGSVYLSQLHHHKLSLARAELAAMKDEERLKPLLFENVDIVTQAVPILRKYRLSAFR